MQQIDVQEVECRGMDWIELAEDRDGRLQLWFGTGWGRQSEMEMFQWCCVLQLQLWFGTGWGRRREMEKVQW